MQHRLVDELDGRKIAKTLSGSVVDQIQNRVKLLVSNFCEVGAFWEEETKQAIHILVTAALPGGVRIRKINLHIQGLFQVFEAEELGAVVQSEGNGRYLFGFAQSGDEGRVGGFDGLVPCNGGYGQTGLSVNTGDQIAFADRAVYCITLEVTQTASLISDRLPVMNGTVKIAGIGLLFVGIRLGFSPEMRAWLDAGEGAGSYGTVNGSKRDLILMFRVPSSGNDLRRPEQKEFFQHESKGGGILCQIIFTMAFLSPVLVTIVGVPMVIPIGLLAPVALHFTTDGGGAALQIKGDLTNTFSFF